MPAKNGPVIEAMRALSASYPRFGARRIQLFLRRDGMEVGKERCSRLWAQAGLQVPTKRRRRRVAQTGVRPYAPEARNSVWCFDFVFDACANGHQLKCVTVIEEYTRECLAMEWFRNRIEAKIVIEDWRTHYYEVRPHSSLQYMTPVQFRRSIEVPSTNGA
jgi:putative transposase